MRVRWTEAEILAIVNGAVELLLQDGLSARQAIIKAQRHLEPKRRHNADWNPSPQLIARVRLAATVKRTPPPKVVELIPPPPPPTAEEIVLEAARGILGRVAKLEQLDEILESLKVLHRKVDELIHRSPRPVVEIVGNEVRKPRVLVYGLLPDQLRHVQNKRPQVEIVTGSLSGTPLKADLVIVVTGFYGHAQEATVRERAGAATFARAGRGTSSVLTLVDRWLRGEVR